MYIKLLILSIIVYESNCQSHYVFKNCTTTGLEKWLKLDNSSTCYYVSGFSNKLTWHDANDWCLRMGGQLASIHDQTDNQFLPNITYAFYSYYTYFNAKFWIGLNAMAERGTYKWSDGSAYQYSHFPPLNPPDGVHALDTYTFYTQGRCVYYSLINRYDYTDDMYHTYGYWYYDNCNSERNYVCENTGGIVSTPAPTPIPAGNCPPDWIQYDNRKCIKILNTSLSYTASQDRCRQMNGDLISISSAKEQNFITALIANTSSSPYIGIAMDEQTDTWSWPDQSSVSYTNWAKGISDSYYSYCVTILSSEQQTGKWNKTKCDTLRPAICEQPKNISITTAPPNPIITNCTLFPSFSDNFIQYRNACYYISNANSEWNNAESECQKMNGSHLVSITSGFEYSFLMYYTKQFTPNASYWIGLSSQQTQANGLSTQQTYEWVDDWPVFNTYWDEDEPMQRSQLTQVSVYQINGLWKTDDPKQYRKYICKRSNEKLTKNDNNLIGNCPLSNSLDPLKSWVDVNKKLKYCYWFSVDLGSSVGRDGWYSSTFHCKQRGGTLVSIHEMFDLQVLKNKITPKSSSSSSYDTWLGLYQAPEGAYVWDDGSAVDFTNWDETDGNYNSGSQTVDYCVSVRASDLKWTKNKCSGYSAPDYYYICQVPKIYNSNSTQATPPSTVTTPTVSVPQNPTTLSNTPLPTTATLSNPPSTSTDSSKSSTLQSIGEKPNTDTGDSVGLSNGAKAGIIIAVVFVASALICGAVFAFIKYRSRDQSVNSCSNSLYSSKRRVTKHSKTDSS